MFTIKIILYLLLLIILLFLTILFFFSTITSIADQFRNSAPFVPLRKRGIIKLVNELEITADSVVYDLGAGDGRILYYLANVKKVGTYIGIERSVVPLVFSLYFRFLLRKSSCKFTMLKQDIFKTDVSKATHVIMYLFPDLMNDLLPKLEKELKPGTLVYAVDFEFKNKKPDHVVDLRSGSDAGGLAKTLYVYRF